MNDQVTILTKDLVKWFRTRRSTVAAVNEVDAAVLKKALETANQEVFARAEQDPEHASMGCTAAVVWMMTDGYAIAHVGDSRVYRLRRGRLEPLTRDHSYVQELVDRGTISPKEAAVHSQRHIITRAIGGKPSLQAEVATGDFEPGDTFLLCTDGFSGVVPEDQAERYLASAGRLQKACDALVEEAKKAGGPDNITVALVRPHFDIPTRAAYRIERLFPRFARLVREATGLSCRKGKEQS